MNIPLIIAAAVVIFVATRGVSAEGYGPWPGARAAEASPPLRSRPRDYRDVELRPAPPESRPPGSYEAEKFYSDLACDAADFAEPSPPMAAERVPLKTKILDVPGFPLDETFGRCTRLSSACAADDTTAVAAILDEAQPVSDPNSRGRNVTGLLRGVELSA